LAAGPHVLANFLQQVKRSSDIRIDNTAHVVKILIQKASAQTASGIGQQSLDRTSIKRRVKFVDAFNSRKIRLDRFGRGTEVSELGCRLIDRRFIGCDDKVKTVPSAAFCQFEADAGGSPGNDREWTSFICHFGGPLVQGFSTTLMQPSCLSRKVL
jgi:hypothetical protein